MGYDAESPVIARPPFLSNGAPQPEANIRIARLSVRLEPHASERGRDREVVILAEVSRVFGPERKEGHFAVRIVHGRSVRLERRIRHDDVPDVKGEDAVLRQRTTCRQPEGSRSTQDGRIDATLRRLGGQIAEPKVGPDEEAEVAVAGRIERSHRRGGTGNRSRRSMLVRRRWRPRFRIDALTLHADPLALAIDVLAAAFLGARWYG